MAREINMQDSTPRQVRCIGNEYRQRRTGRMVRNTELEVGQLYWIENLEENAYGSMVFLYEIPSKNGFYSYLFEEVSAE